ncbi:hypothetical protein Tco_1346424 [Tanacetum coccineum]
MSGVSAGGSGCLGLMDEGCGGGVERLRKTDKWCGCTTKIVRIKRLLDDLRVTAAKLILLVQKLLLLILKVNAAGMKVTTAKRLQLPKEFMLTKKRSKTYQRKNKY